MMNNLDKIQIHGFIEQDGVQTINICKVWYVSVNRPIAIWRNTLTEK